MNLRVVIFPKICNYSPPSLQLGTKEYCRYMDIKKGILLKKTRNHSQLLNPQQMKKLCHNDMSQHRSLINITGRL